MGDGSAITLTVAVTKQPVLIVYVIIAEPIAFPETNPDVAPTEAIAGLLLDQEPPPTPANNDEVPKQIDVAPVMAAGRGLTVTF
jgi:hypothetical protein